MSHIGNPAPRRYAAQNTAGDYDDSDNVVGDDLGLTADPAESQAIDRVRSRGLYRASVWATLALLVGIMAFFYVSAVFLH